MRRKAEGMFTVEAVFIVPFIIFVIMALFYLSFYAYDSAVIDSCINKMVIREGQHLCHPTDINSGQVQYSMINQRSLFYLLNYDKSQENSKVETYVKNEIAKKLSITTIDIITANMNKENIEINVKASLNIPFLPAKEFLSKLLQYQITVKSEAYNPEKFCHIYDSVAEALDDTAFYQSVKKYVKKIDQTLKK